MLGTLRCVLALMVVGNHLWQPTLHKIGAQAVIAFYVISGYLMTRVVSEIYKGKGGAARYFANRFLRIFPTYWLVLAATAAGLLIFPAAFGRISSTIRLPQDGYDWLQNLSLINLIYEPIRLVPPAWSLSVEWVFYIAIGMGLTRKAGLTALIWVAALAYAAWLLWSGAPFGARYTPPAAVAVFFASGALLYHILPARLSMPLHLPSWLGLVALFIAWPLIVEAWGGDRRTTGFYGAFLLFVPLFVWTLVAQPFARFAGTDEWLGDLTYPLFLSHYFAAGVVNLLFSGLAPLGHVHFAVSLVVCVALSALIVLSFDPHIGRMRDRLRPARDVQALRAAP